MFQKQYIHNTYLFFSYIHLVVLFFFLLIFYRADCWGDIKCQSRLKMQNKYLEQIFDLYEHCHIVTMPLLDAEVRGVELLKYFAANLEEPFVPGTVNEYRQEKVKESTASKE